MSVWLLDQIFVLLHIHTLFKLFHVFNTCGSRVTTNILMLIISQIVVPTFLFWYLKELRAVSISCDNVISSLLIQYKKVLHIAFQPRWKTFRFFTECFATVQVYGKLLYLNTTGVYES